MPREFLNLHQQEILQNHKWDVNPKGKYLTLYKEDFSYRSWEEVCQQLNIDTSTEEVDILYFGVKTN
jgi:hypothetical protein